MPAATDTVTVVAVFRAPAFSIAVTVTGVPETPTPSDTAAGFTDSAIEDDAASLSAIVTVGNGVATVRPDAAVVPLTVTVSFPSVTSSSTGISVNVASPLVASAGIVSGKSVTAAKSSADAVPAATEIVTSVSVVRAPAFSIAVTVTVSPEAPTPSDTSDGFTDSAIVSEAVSSSVSISVAGITVSPATPPPTRSSRRSRPPRRPPASG